MITHRVSLLRDGRRDGRQLSHAGRHHALPRPRHAAAPERAPRQRGHLDHPIEPLRPLKVFVVFLDFFLQMWVKVRPSRLQSGVVF